MTTNAIFPLDRVVTTQPRRVTVCADVCAELADLDRRHASSVYGDGVMHGALSLVLLLGGVNAACVEYRPPPQGTLQTGRRAGDAPKQVWAVRAGRALTGHVELQDGKLYGAGVDRKVYAVDLDERRGPVVQPAIGHRGGRRARVG